MLVLLIALGVGACGGDDEKRGGIYAEDRLALAGAGVEVAEIRLADSKYRYRYSGLRLLVRSEDRYVLVPVGWSRGRGSVYVLRDEGDVRLELAAH